MCPIQSVPLKFFIKQWKIWLWCGIGPSNSLDAFVIAFMIFAHTDLCYVFALPSF